MMRAEIVAMMLKKAMRRLEVTVGARAIATDRHEEWSRAWAERVTTAKRNGALAEVLALRDEADMMSEEVGKSIRPAIEAVAYFEGVSELVSELVAAEPTCD